MQNHFSKPPKKASHSSDAGNQRLASNHVGKGGLNRARSGKSCTIFRSLAHHFPVEPTSRPIFSHPRPFPARTDRLRPTRGREGFHSVPNSLLLRLAAPHLGSKLRLAHHSHT